MHPADALAERLGLSIRDRDLLAQALTHSSWHHEHPEELSGHNERLELLGDSVVNLAISDALFARHPEDDEGILSARRAAIVSSTGLARLATRLDLGAHLRLGEGESHRGGGRRPALLAASFEAVVGALYLDLGWDVTRAWLTELAAPEIALETPPVALKSPKSRLQEHTQRSSGGRPVYRVTETSGPDHEKQFAVEVEVAGVVLGRGAGPSRRIAETMAAGHALDRLRRAREGAA